jgi:signal transduction histidine kinase
MDGASDCCALTGALTRPSLGGPTPSLRGSLERLQDAAKHAGPGATVTIRLSEAEGRVCFHVEDDEAGFDPGAVQRGAGVTNLADRVAAVGGTLRIDAGPDAGPTSPAGFLLAASLA